MNNMRLDLSVRNESENSTRHAPTRSKLNAKGKWSNDGHSGLCWVWAFELRTALGNVMSKLKRNACDLVSAYSCLVDLMWAVLWTAGEIVLSLKLSLAFGYIVAGVFVSYESYENELHSNTHTQQFMSQTRLCKLCRWFHLNDVTSWV